MIMCYLCHNNNDLFALIFSDLHSKLKNFDVSTLKPFEPGKPEKFGSFMDKVMGIS